MTAKEILPGCGGPRSFQLPDCSSRSPTSARLENQNLPAAAGNKSCSVARTMLLRSSSLTIRYATLT
ncbi:hypothetical protein NDU88_007215 [Pleurodeles waltl]|uniref:Uncharacterized protein n=1 Tax=Pleurodeles waltl TaxID=8319 RepID=A0AAV7MFU0_PLEWA|nr:hypothetical protein NDU88_007215 [Pleurodeles waltl]